MFFFRVELSLFDEERQTIYLYPDTQALDKDETPFFSESALTANPVFKRYVKQLKTDVVDIKYGLYEAKDIVFDEMNDEEFEQLLSQNKLRLIDQNDFCIVCGKMKSKSGRKKNNSMFVLIVAAFAVMLLLGAMSMKKGDQPVIDSSQTEPEESGDISSDISISDENSNILTESSSSQSSIDPQESVSSSSDISTSSTDTTSNENITTSSVISSTTLQTTSGSANSQPTESTSTVSNVPQSSTSESDRVNTTDIFNIHSQSDMTVTLYYDIEEPTVSFISPDGAVISATEISSSHGDGAVSYYILNAIAGQWKINYDKKGNNSLDINWAPYERSDIPQDTQTNFTSENGGSV